MNNKQKDWALITGANGGIGQVLVQEFAKKDYNVIAVDLDETDSFGSNNIVYIQNNLEQYVLSHEYADEFCAKVEEVTQGCGIKVLVNNAAIQILGSCENINREQWQTSFNVNLSAPFFLIQSFLPSLAKNYGAIVNVSSIHAIQTKREFVTYATTKAGLSSLTRNLAVDIGNKVRINAVEPAAVGTKMLKAGFKGASDKFKQLESFHPLSRIATPKEIADIVIFLCSEKASFIHGECISITGGIHGCLNDPSD